MNERKRRGTDLGTRQQAADDTHISHVNREAAYTGRFQAIKCQQLSFEVGFQTGMTVDLGTELQRLTRGMGTISPGVQHGATVAKAGYTVAI